MGRVLREQRENAQLTQERFAELVDLSKNYIGNIERGEYEISITKLHQIAEALKHKASDLIRQAGY
ncbi:MAG: helix-turn-helix transcriptional regulator [Verrucomicrobiota bacterium]